MNDKDRELLQQILDSAGTAGAQGFSYLVHYTSVSARVGIVVFGLLATICMALGLTALIRKWQFREGVVAVCGFGLFISALTFCVAVPEALAPEGAAVRDIIKHMGQ